jgi:molybdopterin-guanine dinucleotide biosynthesis protein A
MTGIILAGGEASRMGGTFDKAFLKIDKKPIINLQVGTFKNIFKETIIVTNSPHRYKNLKDVMLVPDIILGLGPLGGIYSGLLASVLSIIL